MSKLKKFVIRNYTFVIVFILFAMPALSLAAGLVSCGGANEPACDWNGLMTLVNTVINFLLFYMAIPIAAIMFAYAGFELVSSGGSTEKRGIAKKVFTSAVIGLILAVAAWLIVSTVLSILGYDGSWIGLKLIQ
jgi:hypothetical protein